VHLHSLDDLTLNRTHDHLIGYSELGHRANKHVGQSKDGKNNAPNHPVEHISSNAKKHQMVYFDINISFGVHIKSAVLFQ